MIDVNNIINYNRTDEELEELILFLVAVAGKNADTTARQLDKLLSDNRGDETTFSPFQKVKLFAYFGATAFQNRLKRYGFGCYNRLARAFTELANSGMNLRTCTKEELMTIHGIGRKSASCFLAWTRKGVKVAMLDTHLLKWMKSKQDFLKTTGAKNIEGWKQFITVSIPKSTPSSKKLYDILESFYIAWCMYVNVDPTEYDLEIWRSYANKQ